MAIPVTIVVAAVIACRRTPARLGALAVLLFAARVVH